MKNAIRSNVAAISLAASLLTASSAFAMGSSIFTGSAGDENGYDRVVNISPDTRWVNAEAGESVKFVDSASGKSFVWRFDVGHWTAFDLSTMVPEVLGSHHVTAYVNTDPNEGVDD